MANAGRTSAAMPRSTNQPRPFCGDLIQIAPDDRLDEEAVGSRNEVVVAGQTVRSQGHAAYQFSHEFRPIAVRKRFEFVEQLLRSLGSPGEIHM
jgi:hypothetical protein